MSQMPQEWEGFVGGHWTKEINVREFIQKNYTPYYGDESFLAGPTEATKKLWADVMELAKKEREAGGVLDMDTKVVSSLLLTQQVILIRIWSRSLVSRQTSPSRELLCLTAV